MITLRELSAQLNTDRSNLRKYIIGNRICAFERIRDPECGNQVMLAVTEDDAELIRQHRRDHGFSCGDQPAKPVKPLSEGVFYVVRLLPDSLPARLKLGFSVSMSDRLQDFRVVCPHATKLADWPCKRTHEPAAIDAMAASGLLEHVGGEVYDLTGTENDLLELGHKLFGLLSPG